MQLIFMTGSHPRHLYTARQLYDAGLLAGLVVEKRSSFQPKPPESLEELDKANFIRHFQDREDAEHRAFGHIDLDLFRDLPILQVTARELNSESTKQWLLHNPADMVVSYGIHKLEKDILEVLPELSWNIHGGLSPWYRGTVTLFWPFYFLKPNWAGMTIHKLSSKIDAGDIIHHSVPILERGHGIHDVACNAVKEAADDLLKIIGRISSGHAIEAVAQKSSGKLFLNSDWTPQHLRLIYNTFNNDIVDRFLDGEFGKVEPNLVRAF